MRASLFRVVKGCANGSQGRRGIEDPAGANGGQLVGAIVFGVSKHQEQQVRNSCIRKETEAP